jgi:hypothetical protein
MSDERKLMVLLYKGEAPSMAVCSQCQYKFFVPNTLNEKQGAEEYLQEKFSQHECSKRPKVIFGRRHQGVPQNFKNS